MTPEPKFSILIPTYNRASYLLKAVESALAQKYQNFEVVVSDNASSDDTESISRRYRNHHKVRWFRNRANIGLDGNWRRLVYDYATGDYAKILADDDYLGNVDHLDEAVRVIRKADVDVIFAGAGSFDERSNLLADRSWEIPEILSPQWWIQNIGKRDKGKTLFPNLTTCGIFNLAKAKELKAFVDPVFGMDYQLGFQLMLSGPSAYLRRIHGVERKHPSNDGANAKLSVVMSSLKLYDRLLDYGRRQRLAERDVRTFCRTFMGVMIDAFIVFAWSRERGATVRSAHELYETLKEKDPVIAKKFIRSPRSLARFFFGATAERQDALRRFYYQLCALRDHSK